MIKIQNERLVMGGIALLIGLLLGWMLRGVGTYNSHMASVSTYGDWRVACPAADANAENCQLISEITDKNADNPVARATIATDRDGTHILAFTLPYGVALEAGMGLIINKDPVKVYPYRSCNTVGCIATTPLNGDLASSLKGATEGKLLFAGLDGKPVAVPLSFKGYNKAFSAWRSNDAKRHSWFWRLWS